MNNYQKLILTISVMFASLMQSLDTTIANVALPHIQGSISASLDEISWILTSYITASAVAALPVAWFSKRFGSKKIFLLSVTGFTISSIFCGFSNSIEQIVLFRIFQGIFGAALIPLSQLTLLEINPPEKAGSAMALWGAGIMVGPILGPSLGGYLTDNYNWRWVFYINVPFGILSFFGISRYCIEKDKEYKNLDKIGFVLFSLFIISLQLLLDRGNIQDWFDSAEINIYFIVLLSTIWLLGCHFLFSKSTFISPEIFRDKNFSISLILIFLVGIILLATMSIIPPMLQNLINYPITTVGIIMVPRGIGTMITMAVIGKLIERGANSKILIQLGLIIIIISLYQMTQVNLNLTSWIVIQNGFIQGIGLGLVFLPLATISLSTMKITYRSEAAGLFNLVRNIGSSIGISIISTLVNRSIQINHEQLGLYFNKYNINDIANLMRIKNPILLSSILNVQINIQSQFIAYLNCFKLMMFIVFPTIILVFFLKHNKYSSSNDLTILE